MLRGSYHLGVVVVVEKHDAYTKLAPPLLNRFEKQVMDRGTVRPCPQPLVNPL